MPSSPKRARVSPPVVAHPESPPAFDVVEAGRVLHLVPVLDAEDDVDVVCVSGDGVIRVIRLRRLPRLYLVPVVDGVPPPIGPRNRLSPRVCRRASPSCMESQSSVSPTTTMPLPWCEVEVPTPYTMTVPGAKVSTSCVVLRARVCLCIGYSSVLYLKASSDAVLGSFACFAAVFAHAIDAPLEMRPAVDLRVLCGALLSKLGESRDTPPETVLVTRLAVSATMNTIRMTGMSLDTMHLFASLGDVPLCNIHRDLLRVSDAELASRAPFMVQNVLSMAYSARVAMFEGDSESVMCGGHYHTPAVHVLVHESSSPRTLTHVLDVVSMYPSVVVNNNICVADVGVLPRVVRQLVHVRRDPAALPVHRACAKILANSAIGKCASTTIPDGFPWVNRFAMSRVTRAGRDALQTAIARATEMGAVVLGGVVDSLFVTNVDEAELLELCGCLSRETLLKFRAVDVYSAFVMINKQSWAGIPQVAPGGKVVVESRGIASMPAADMAITMRTLLHVLRGNIQIARALLRAHPTSVPTLISSLVLRPLAIGTPPCATPSLFTPDFLQPPVIHVRQPVESYEVV